MLVLRPFSRDDFSRMRTWAPTAKDVYLFAGSELHWPLSDDTLTEWLMSTDAVPWTAELRSAPGVPVGHIELVRTGEDTGRLARVLLDPECRGRGYGRAMVAAAIDAARDMGVRDLGLNVIRDNHQAINTYLGLGFIVQGPSATSSDMLSMSLEP